MVAVRRFANQMEVRFNTPPANGINVNPQWDDPTGQVVYDIESGSDHLTISPTLPEGIGLFLDILDKLMAV